MPLLEVCCGNLESVRAAVAAGARRIELCTALEQDGLTPPPEWVRTVKRHCPGLTVHVLIRPRAGDFQYAEAEVATMEAQLEEALEAGADGVVIGALTPDGAVDVPAVERLVRMVGAWNLAAELGATDFCHAAHDAHLLPGEAHRVSITFHRAFDVCRDPFAALEDIIRLGCDRILTSGQAPTALEGAALLKTLRRRAAGRIGLLPGGGITAENARAILRETGCTEIHASASEVVDGRKVTSQRKVTALLQALSERD